MGQRTSKRTVSRTVIAAAIMSATALVLSACGGAATAQSAKDQVKTLRYEGSANSVTLPELAADLGYLGDLKLDWVGNTISGPASIQNAATGNTEFGGAFAGAVVKLQEAGAPVKAVIDSLVTAQIRATRGHNRPGEDAVRAGVDGSAGGDAAGAALSLRLRQRL